MSGYAVATDGLNGKTLFTVNRSKVKDRWWTEGQWHLAMRFTSEAVARQAASRLSHNNPRVVEWAEAEAIMEEQSMDDTDWAPEGDGTFFVGGEGWDDHKFC